jgi:hypothetical protein
LRGDLQDVVSELVVVQHEHLTLTGEALQDAALHVGDRGSRCKVDAKEVRGVIVPVALKDRAIDQNRSLLIRVIDDDTNDRQSDDAGRRGQLKDVSDFAMPELSEIVRHEDPLAGSSRADHVGYVAIGHAGSCRPLDARQIHRKQHDRCLLEHHASLSDGLHCLNPGHRGEFVGHRRRKANSSHGKVR